MSAVTAGSAFYNAISGFWNNFTSNIDSEILDALTLVFVVFIAYFLFFRSVLYLLKSKRLMKICDIMIVFVLCLGVLKTIGLDIGITKTLISSVATATDLEVLS